MERVDKTIAGRISIAVLAVHLVVLPALYFAVVFLVKQSNEELFINNVRIHARFIADSLEHLESIDDGKSVVDILDSVVLSGDGMYAELYADEQRWTGSLVSEEAADQFEEDFSFGEHGGSTYFLSLPVVIDETEYRLRLGFDETPIVAANQKAYIRGFLILAIYLVVILGFVSFIGRRVMRPIKALQASSRHISSGNFSEHLTVDTDLVEFVELSRDLELMRTHLIGINRQLQDEIQIKERTESERQKLEHQLQHRHRLETVGTLAGGIAHELNNILVPILLYTETAMDDLPDSSPVRDDLKRVIRASSRARGIVQQVLTFGRQIGADNLEPLDLADIIKESIDLMRASFSPTVEINVSFDEHCPQVIGNASLLGQVVINLCTNAYQALPQAKGRIDVSLEHEDISNEQVRANSGLQKGSFVRLSVEDSGEGMDEEMMERIFEPFFTGRNVGEGTGLGLSVVHGIVTNIGGEIVVTSSVGNGTRIDVYFQAYEPQNSAATTAKTGLN